MSLVEDISGFLRRSLRQLSPVEDRPATQQQTVTLRSLPRAARIFVVAVIALAAILAVGGMSLELPDLRLFTALLLGSILASLMKLKLPLGTGSSNLSISYTFDFATLLLLGTGPASIVAACSAWAQSRLATSKHNPTFRVIFNMAALVVTVHAAGAIFGYSGGRAGAIDLLQVARPLVATALTYYLVNSAIVATIVAVSNGESPWKVWHANFLWTAPSYFVGAAAAAAGIALLRTEHGWFVPLMGAPVYLTFRSYRMYLDRIRSEKHYNEEVLRLLDAARRSEQRYALAAAGSNDGLWDWDLPNDTLYCSDRWKLMFGLSPDTSISTFQEWLNYVVEEDRPGLRKALDMHLGGESPHFEHEYRVRHENGDLKSVLCRGIAVRDETGRPVRMAGSQTDITEWRRVQETLAKAARHDPLTGLPNRTLFGELLQREMARTARMPERRYAVLFIDLDGFKLVNDSLGHLVGDHFLIAIAQRLQSRLRPGDSLARLGGDEFAVLVADISGSDDVTIVADRMQKALADPFEVQGHEIYASASIGIVLGDDQYKSVSDLLRDADTAMYRAKAVGRGGYELFDPTMHASAMNRLTLETDLRRAVERNEFVVFFQPIVELITSEVCGFEALVRWRRPSGELASPAEFIAAAEETGLIVPMTTFVLHEAARQVASWQAMFGRPNMYVSVNISPKLFARSDLVEQVEAAMQQSGLTPGTLCLELTEGVLMKHSETTNRNFEQLRQLHVPLYLDDFGTGYSSLSYLQKFPVDALKLDRSFVARFGTEEDSSIATVIATLARELGIGLIAEGVETELQAEQLLALECPHAQGTLFSRPLAGPEVEKLLWEVGASGLAAAS